MKSKKGGGRKNKSQFVFCFVSAVFSIANKPLYHESSSKRKTCQNNTIHPKVMISFSQRRTNETCVTSLHREAVNILRKIKVLCLS